MGEEFLPCAGLHAMDDVMYKHHRHMMHNFYHYQTPSNVGKATLQDVVDQVNHNRDALHSEMSDLAARIPGMFSKTIPNKPSALMNCPHCYQDLKWPRSVNDSGLWDHEHETGERLY